MIFDLACRVAEKQIPELRKPLRQAALFLFGQNAHEFLPKHAEQDEVEFFMENFFLPFPTIALEDTGSVVILSDTQKDAVGVESERQFIEIMPADVRPEAYRVEEQAKLRELQAEGYSFPPGSCLATFGTIRIAAFDGVQFALSGSLHRSVLANEEEVFADRRDITDSGCIASGLRNAGTACQEVMYLNTADRYVVEVSNMKTMDKTHHPKHIRRSHERPLYTLLRPGELREKMGLSESTGRTQTPHWRRRHFRRLDNDRFVNKKGQVVIVRQSWVGPEEATVGNKKYKVLLNH